MFEITAALVLALIYATIIGVRKGAHKEGSQGMNDFAIPFGIAFALIVGLFALIALMSG